MSGNWRPPSSTDVASRFPCLRSSTRDDDDDGGGHGTSTVRRAPSIAFHIVAADVVPSVCWCAELTAAPPRTIAALCTSSSSSTTTTTTREARQSPLHPTCPFVVTPLPLLHDDPHLERKYVLHAANDDDDDAPWSSCVRREASVRAAKCEQVGLSLHHDDHESIVKFGSTRAAKLAVRFGNDAVRSAAATVAASVAPRSRSRS